MSSCCTSRVNTGSGYGRRRCSIATTTSRAPCASRPMRRPCWAAWRASVGMAGGGATPSGGRLVVNADDFGLSSGVNDGILEAHAAGVVSSVSVLVNAPGWEHAVAALRGTESLGVGLHLNLTAGEPLSEARTLVDAHTGRFHGLAGLVTRALTGRIDRLGPRPGVTELMVHPGRPDRVLAAWDGYVAPRAAELAALTSSAVRERLGRGDVCLTHFGAV